MFTRTQGRALDRIGRLIGNVFTAPPAVLAVNGNGKAAPTPTGAKLRTTYAQFIPLNSQGDTLNTDALTEDWYALHWLVYACMRIRAIKLIEPPLWVWEEREGEKSPILGNHEIYPLLERPNEDQDLSQLLYATSVLLDSGGECLWVKNRDRAGRPGMLTAFGKDQIEKIESDGRRLYARFKVRTAAGSQWFNAEQVIYFREHGGVAPLQTIAARLGIDRQLLVSMESAIRNSVTAGASLEFPPEFNPDPEQRDELLAFIAGQYQGARERGRLFAAGGGAKLVKHNISFAGLEGGELTKELEAAVCAAFQVPPAIVGAYVGLENSSDRANMETAERYLYDVAIIPRWRWMERILTRSLLRDFDQDTFRTLGFAQSEVPALQDDLTEKAAIVSATADILTVNERRGLMGYPPLPGPEGDSLRAPVSPFGAAEEEPEEEEEEAEEEEPKAAAAPEAKAVFDPNSIAWHLYHASTEAQEYGWKLAALNQLRADRERVLEIAERTLKPAKKDDGPPFGPADPASVDAFIREVEEMLDPKKREAFRNVLNQLADNTGKQAVTRVAAQLGVSFDLLQPGLLKFTEREAAWLVKEIDTTTRNAVADAIKAGLREGAAIRRSPDSNVPSLVERIMDAGAFGEKRAELIARTEATRVTNGAAVESLREYRRERGGAFKKTWLSARDARVRDEHQELDGETVDLDARFSNGLEAPGEPNCRCTLLYTMED